MYISQTELYLLVPRKQNKSVILEQIIILKINLPMKRGTEYGIDCNVDKIKIWSFKKYRYENIQTKWPKIKYHHQKINITSTFIKWYLQKPVTGFIPDTWYQVWQDCLWHQPEVLQKDNRSLSGVLTSLLNIRSNTISKESHLLKTKTFRYIFWFWILNC